MAGENLTSAFISSSNLEHNYRLTRNRIPGHCRVMGVVKANAYGHDAAGTSKILERLGVRDFGVANIVEAASLRKHLTVSGRPEILAFSSPLPDHIARYLEHDIAATICDFDMLRAAESIASAHNVPLKVHVKIDTGMGRLGTTPESAFQLLEAAEKSPHLTLLGIYTHFAQSTSSDAFTGRQRDLFTQICSEFEHRVQRTFCKHAANSGGILCHDNAFFDMVRPGIMLYGYFPDDSVKGRADLKPVMVLSTKVMFIKEVEAGTTISYNRTWTAPSRRRIATLSAGYADGYPRTLSNRTTVSIRGKTFPQVGTITMDQFMVDLGNDRDVRVGDDALLFGGEGISAADLALTAGTISYELLCAVSSRVRRVFV
ncbi:MAG: alanine racemase [Ignavibacteriaceae bacterium]|nr:alanine racemase [Ignavibacteriaceae bacterium]